MKKFILKVTMVAAFAAVAGYGVYAGQKEEATLSDTALANVEALARGEGSSPYRLFPCPDYNGGNECKTSSADRPECWSISYCH